MKAFNFWVTVVAIAPLGSCSKKEGNEAVEKYKIKIEISPAGSGTIERSKEEPYAPGEKVTLKALPNEGYDFVTWSGNINTEYAEIILTMEVNYSLKAEFSEKNFYLASNRVTIKCPNAKIGEKGVVNGITYTKRSRDQITPENAANSCTSGITDMSELFARASSFNQDLSSWCVQNISSSSPVNFALGSGFESNAAFYPIWGTCP